MSPRDTILKGQETLADLRKTMTSLQRRALVLLVEDFPDDVELTSRVFAQFDIILDIVTSAQDAIAKLKAKDYDVIFLDLVLPDCSGLDVISQAVARQSGAFFIVLTGINDENPMIKEALDRGAKCVIRKPITPEHVRLIFGSVP